MDLSGLDIDVKLKERKKEMEYYAKIFSFFLKKILNFQKTNYLTRNEK
jgi:hypothetical protein